jgi:hypothetical protein
MARKSVKDKTKSISFGRKGELARSVVERMEKQLGKTEFSKFVRDAVVAYSINKPEFKQIKIDGLLEQRKILQKRFKELNDEILKNSEELEKYGVDLDKHDY